MDTKDLKNRILARRKVKNFKLGLSFEIAKRITEARIRRGISQKKLAKLMNTHQSAIARLESGRSPQSITQIERVAKALKTEVIPPTFGCLKDRNFSANVISNFSMNSNNSEKSENEVIFKQNKTVSSVNYLK